MGLYRSVWDYVLSIMPPEPNEQIKFLLDHIVNLKTLSNRLDARLDELIVETIGLNKNLMELTKLSKALEQRVYYLEKRTGLE